MNLKLKTLTAAVFAALAMPTQAADLQPYSHKGQVLQRLSSFDNPEGAIFSADGKYVFISNAAEQGNVDKGFSWTPGRGVYLEARSAGRRHAEGR